jgi:hypothetical protein
MDARTVDGNGDDPPTTAQTPAPAPADVARRGKGRWLRGGSAAAQAGAALVEELEAELALLREENARLKIRGARDGSIPWDSDAEDAAPDQALAGDARDDLWELITECQVLRNALSDACRDLDVAMQRVRGRLDAHGSSGEKAAP